jgi:MFS family permease
VNGNSATESGYQILPLLLGLIVSAIATGQIVSATKRYKALTVGALLVTALGLFLLTNIRPDTPEPMLWLWMAITGVGIGPTFAVFTLVVQNAVPVRFLGTATSSLTLFQQVGGTIGLAIAGTIFGSVVLDEVPKRMADAGVPEQFAGQFASGGSDFLNSISQVGDLGAAILAQVPDEFRSVVEPLIPGMVNAIHEAISIATGATFVLGIITALLAALVVLIVMPAGKIGEQAS